MKGSEFPMVVIFTTFIEGPHNENIFSRCKSSLIVVCNEEHAKKIVPEHQECSFAYIIPVHGNWNWFKNKDASIRTLDAHRGGG